MPGRQLCLTVLAAAILAADAHASIGLFFSPPGHLTLLVDAAGNAEASWSAGGRRQTMLIPPQGYYHAGRTLPGPDVSVAAPGVALPYRKAVRRTPDGRYWALQACQTSFGGKVELRFSRWTGVPTKIELAFQDQGAYRLLVGKATFHGKPVSRLDFGAEHRLDACA